MLHRRKGLIILLVLSLTFGLLAGCTGDNTKDTEAKPADKQGIDLDKERTAEDAAKVIATYEGGEVTLGEFLRYLDIFSFLNPNAAPFIGQADIQETLLKTYIAEQILIGRSDQSEADFESDAIKFYEGLEQDLLGMVGGDQEKLQELFTEFKVEKEDIVRFYSRLKMIEASLLAQVDETSLRETYAESKEQFTIATVSHILISIQEREEEEALKLANEIREKLLAGEDFAALAKQFSDDPGSKDNGGTYENAEVGLWVEEFKQASLTLPLNEISEPVKTDFGYHIMKVSERTEKSFDDVRNKLESMAVNDLYDQFFREELPELIQSTNLNI